MLHLFHSNRLDALADAMLDGWPGPSTGDAIPAPELVIVPSRAVERWLTWRIADRNGVCANVGFRFAAKFIWETFARALPGVPENSPFDSDVTALRLFSYLGALPKDEDLRPLAAYLDGHDDLRRFELATRIAKLFSEYMVYRPDWLDRWAKGADVDVEPAPTQRWQKHLWAWLLSAMDAKSLTHPKDAFFAELARRPQGAAGIVPPRVRVFGLPSVPPLYLDILSTLARFVDVEWYALNPCRMFWADIVTERSKAKAWLARDPAEPLMDVGHPLLASWGGQARSQHALLAERSGAEGTLDDECFVTPQGTSLLHRLQASLVELAPLPADSIAPDAEDRSIRIHACHGLTRQVEVLHDQLLGLFDAMPGLKPSDIAVFTPDLDGLAPLVEAVFGSAPQGRRIPFAVTGRATADGAVLRAAQFLFGLAGSRFEAAAVLGFLEIPAVSKRYRLDGNDLDTIRRWLAEAGARWGLDARHREKVGVPAESRHTWQETLYRLLVGYALPTAHDGLYRGILPYGEVEGSDAVTLGRLVQALSDLSRAAQAFSQKHRLPDWANLLSKSVGAVLDPLPEDVPELERLRAAIGELARDARSAEVADPVGIDVVRSVLEARLTSSAPGAVPAGVVTFCGLGPMRGMPFRVVCLLGLDADTFPRNPSRLEFDLMKSARRHGDKSARDDDRGGFLDALMSATDVLHLAYTGRSILDNAPLPPSVLVAELTDHLARAVQGGAKAVRKWLVTEHALQPFDQRYFQPGPDTSYAADLVDVARKLDTDLSQRRRERALFGGQPLAPPRDGERNVEFDRLMRFYKHPVRFLLRSALGVRLDESGEELSADEPFSVDGLGRWGLREELLRLRMSGRTPPECLEIVRADPRVPHGLWGRELLEPIAAEVEAFVPRVEAHRGAPAFDPQAFELAIGRFTLSGALSGVGPGGLFLAALRDEGLKDLLGAWIQHLVLCAVKPDGAALETRVVTKDGGIFFGPVEKPEVRLEVLLEHYWKGLQGPLSFFPRSSYDYAKAETPEEGMRAAWKMWAGGYEREGEREERWYRVAFGGALNDLPDDFAKCAEAILRPALRARRDLEGDA